MPLDPASLQILIRRLDGGDPAPRQVFVLPGLTVRGSTAPPPA